MLRQDLEESGVLPALLASDYGECEPGKLPAEEVAAECALAGGDHEALSGTVCPLGNAGGPVTNASCSGSCEQYVPARSSASNKYDSHFLPLARPKSC